MSDTAIFIIVLFVIIGLLVPGVILINYDKNNPKYQIIGWCLIGALITLSCVGLTILAILSSGFALLMLIFLAPLVITVGSVLTIVFGIRFVIRGFLKDIDGKVNKRSVAIGFILIGVHIIIVGSVMTLIILFANGFIPISLM